MTYPIPKDALDDRLGFIGTSGSGKTYNAGGAVERLLKSRARVVIVEQCWPVTSSAATSPPRPVWTRTGATSKPGCPNSRASR